MKKILKIVLPVLAVLCLAYIFSNSLENATKSSKKSSGVTTVVVQTIEKVTKKTVDVPKTESVIRKVAHFSEFALFGLLMAFSLYLNRETLEQITYPVLFCGLFCAVTDEYLQYSSNGRSAQVKDVLIDFAGVLTGFGIAYGVSWLLERNKKKKESL